MIRIRVASVTTLSILLATTASAAELDGRWVCKERAKDVGTIEISGEDYTFTKADGGAGEPGTIDYQGSDPAFSVLSGGLQTDLMAIGAIIAEGVLYVAVEHGGPVECTKGEPD